MAIELEHKFSLAQEGFPSERALYVGLSRFGLRLGPASSRVQRDRYFDTPQRALRRAGYRLRQRHIGEQRLATLKTAGVRMGSLRRREELELPLENGDWPTTIRERLAPLVRLEDLIPWLELTTHRQHYPIYREHRAVAELAYDQVQAARPGASPSASFEEVELEALTDESELNLIAQALTETVALTPSSDSKLGRASTLLGLNQGLEDE